MYIAYVLSYERFGGAYTTVCTVASPERKRTYRHELLKHQ